MAGQHRYTHITALRGDGVSPQILGMSKIVSEDTLRRAAKSDVALTRNSAEGQMELLLPDHDVELWEYTVLVTNSGYALGSMAQLYRDRADAENLFDELKNQWGWGGFTTQDIERCQTSARAVALVYNWWSWYCRAAKPEARMVAITGRALLLASVRRLPSTRGKPRSI